MDQLARKSSFFGWSVVGGTFVLAVFGLGMGFFGPSIYLQAVRETRGWSLPLVSSAVTIHFLIGAIITANLPRLYGRFGIANVTRAGSLLLAAGVVGWAACVTPWQLFAAAVLSGAGWVTMGVAAINAIVLPWFDRGRPRALALAYNGANVGGVVFSPLWVAAIAMAGFPLASLAISGVMVAAVWVLATWLFSKTPEQMGLLPDGDAPDAPPTIVTSRAARPLKGFRLWRDRRFLTLSIGMALGLFAQIGLITHLFSFLVPSLGKSWAGLTMALVTASAIFGRTLIGWFMPLGTDRRLVASISYAVQIVGCILFIAAGGSNVPLLLIGVVLFGIGFGNGTWLPPLIAQVEFVKEDVPRVVALIVALAQGTYAFAPAAFGIVREYAPHYSIAASDALAEPYFFAVAATVQALSILAFMAGRRQRA